MSPRDPRAIFLSLQQRLRVDYHFSNRFGNIQRDAINATYWGLDDRVFDDEGRYDRRDGLSRLVINCGFNFALVEEMERFINGFFGSDAYGVTFSSNQYYCYIPLTKQVLDKLLAYEFSRLPNTLMPLVSLDLKDSTWRLSDDESSLLAYGFDGDQQATVFSSLRTFFGNEVDVTADHDSALVRVGVSDVCVDKLVENYSVYRGGALDSNGNLPASRIAGALSAIGAGEKVLVGR